MDGRAEMEVDAELVSRVAAMPESGQRWLKTVLVTIKGFEDEVEEEEPTPAPRKLKSRDGRKKLRAPVDLEDVVSGRVRLDEQLEAYPELADELEGLTPVIDMLREAGQERRRKGEDVLRELGLKQAADEEEEAGEEETEDS
jgi:hypothetical protein